MLEFKCEYIVGFPSSVYRICKICESQEIKFNGDVKVFFPTAETVTPEHRKVISRFFKCDIKDQYASSEGAPFIFECSEGKLHEDITTGVFEVLPDFENNETGDEIMVTSFHSSGTPLIRYRIGDTIKRSDETDCQCGWHLPIIDEIGGRADDYIETPKNGQINLGNITNSTKNISGLLSFQLEQFSVFSLQVNVVCDEKFNMKEQQKFLNQLKLRFGSEVEISLKIVDEEILSPSGKFRMIIKSF